MMGSIELTNWKTHKHTRLDFSKGINILIGQMGSGKSSIMDAISYALFGTFPSLQHKRVGIGKLVRNKPGQERSAQVKLEFSVDGAKYVVTRDVFADNKPATATIQKDGTYLQSQPQRVTEEIERLLKIDYDLFSKAVYSEQNNLNYFVDISPTDRKKQMDSLLGLDRFAVAGENATSLSNRIRDMVADTEKVVREFDMPQAATDLELMRRKKEKLDEDKAVAEKRLKECLVEKASAESAEKEMKERHAKKQALAKDVESLKSKIALLDAEVRKISASFTETHEEVSSRLEKLKSDREEMRKAEVLMSESEKKLYSEVVKLKSDIDNWSRESAERDKLSKKLSEHSRPAVEKGIEGCKSSMDALTQEAAESRTKAFDADAQAKELAKGKGRCPVCEKDLDEPSRLRMLESKKTTVEDSKKRILHCTLELEKKKSELRSLEAKLLELKLAEDKMKSYAGIDQKLDSCRKSLAVASEGYSKAKVEREDCSKSVQSLNESVQKASLALDSVSRRDRYAKERDGMSGMLSKKIDEHDSIAADQKDLDKVQERLMAITSEASKHSANITAVSSYIKDKSSQITAKEAEIERIKHINEDVARKRDLVDNVSKFRLSLIETQSLLRNHLVNSINGIMQEVWQSLYPYGDYRGLVLDASDNDYRLKVNVMVNNEYVWEDVDAIASGGERSTASLALRIAFSLVLVPNLKWLILDEPTHNIDREGLSKLVQVFGDTLPSIVEQVFIITHDEALKQVSGAKVYSFTRDKDENKETLVQEA